VLETFGSITTWYTFLTWPTEMVKRAKSTLLSNLRMAPNYFIIIINNNNTG